MSKLSDATMALLSGKTGIDPAAPDALPMVCARAGIDPAAPDALPMVCARFGVPLEMAEEPSCAPGDSPAAVEPCDKGEGQEGATSAAAASTGPEEEEVERVAEAGKVAAEMSRASLMLTIREETAALRDHINLTADGIMERLASLSEKVARL